MSGRTFSVTTEARQGVIRSMIGDGPAVVIHADPITTRSETGERISMGFPVLVLTGWVSEPEKFAAHVAKLLQGAFASQDEPTP